MVIHDAVVGVWAQARPTPRMHSQRFPPGRHTQPGIRPEGVKTVGYLIKDGLLRPVVVDLYATPQTVRRDRRPRRS